MFVPVPKSKMRCQVAKALTLIQVETVKSVTPFTMPEGSVAYWEDAAARLRPLPSLPEARVGAPTRVAWKARPLESEATVPALSSNLRWRARVFGVAEASAESGPEPWALAPPTT